MKNETGRNFKVRLTADEAGRLAVRAAAVGLDRSEFIRRLTVSESIPTRLFNRSSERLRAFQLSEISARLETIEAAAVAYLSEARAGAISARLDAIRAQIDRLLPGPAEADQP